MSAVHPAGNAGENPGVWEGEFVSEKSHSTKNPFRGARRLLTIRIPPSRRLQLAETYNASAAVLWAVILAALFTVVYSITQFCIPSVTDGIIGIIFSLFAVYLGTLAARRQEMFEVRLLVFYLGLLVCTSGIILGFCAAHFAKVERTAFPDGCQNAAPDDKPSNFPTTCDRFHRLAIAGIVFMSLVCVSYFSGFTASLVLANRLKVWERAKIPPKRSEQQPCSKVPEFSIAADPFERYLEPTEDPGPDKPMEIDQKAGAPSVPPLLLPPSSWGSETPSDASSKPLTPVKMYHLTDFQLEQGVGRVGSKEGFNLQTV